MRIEKTQGEADLPAFFVGFVEKVQNQLNLFLQGEKDRVFYPNAFSRQSISCRGGQSIKNERVLGILWLWDGNGPC